MAEPRIDEETINKVVRAFPNGILQRQQWRYTDGYSGAPVYALTFKPKGDQQHALDGTYIVKVGTTAWAKREVATYNDLRSHSHVPFIVPVRGISKSISGFKAVAYDFAFDRELAPEYDTYLLADIVAGDNQKVVEAQKQLSTLVRTLLEWKRAAQMSPATKSSNYLTPYGLITRMLGPRRVADIAFRLHEYLPEWDQNVSHIGIEGTRSPVLNPIMFVRQASWAALGSSSVQKPRYCALGPVHGDMHSRNIVCRISDEGTNDREYVPIVIDFADYEPSNVALFDLAYLELDVLLRVVPLHEPKHIRMWTDLLDIATSDLLPLRPAGNGAAYIAWTFLQAIRQHVHDEYCRQPSRTELDFQLVWWAAATAAGLNFARKSGDHVTKTSRMAALIYAAFGLKKLLTLLKADPGVTTDIPMVSVPTDRPANLVPSLSSSVVPLSGPHALQNATRLQAIPRLHYRGGRKALLSDIEQQIIAERDPIVVLIGVPGIGKKVLARKIVEDVYQHFDHVIWHSLKERPSLKVLAQELLSLSLSGQSHQPPDTKGGLVSLIARHMRERRYLVIFDDFEALFERGRRAGTYLEECKEYGDLIYQLSEQRSESCLLITSAETPGPVDGHRPRVKPVKLPNLTADEAQQVLRDEHLIGTSTEWQRLVARFAGNPGVLQTIAEFICELCGCSIGRFLDERHALPLDVRTQIAQWLRPLSPLEHRLLKILGADSEPSTTDTLVHTVQADFDWSASRAECVDAISSLLHRSLITPEQDRLYRCHTLVQEYLRSS